MRLRSVAARAIASAPLISSLSVSPASAEENSEEALNAAFEAESETAEAAVESYTHEQLKNMDSPDTEYTEYTIHSGDRAIMRDAEHSDTQAKYVSCTIRINNPHYSKNAGGAIYKSQVKCSSSGVSTSVKLRLRGLLALRPASSKTAKPGKQQVRGRSDQTVTVRANKGTWSTYYTARTGSHGRTGKGFWTGTTTAQVTSHPSLKGKRTYSKTKVLYANIKK